jgi:hypothetical protein
LPAIREGKTVADFNWTENSKAVFDEAVKTAPMAFRGVTKKSFTKGLTKEVGEGGDVSEADVVKVIKATSPAPFVGQGLKAITPLLSDPSIQDG